MKKYIDKKGVVIVFILQISNKIPNIFEQNDREIIFWWNNILMNILRNTKTNQKRKKNLKFIKWNVNMVIKVVLDKQTKT